MPHGTITRLLEPATFFGAERGSPPAARIITAAVALAALLITFAVLRSPAGDRTGRSLEAAAIVAAGPDARHLLVGKSPRPAADPDPGSRGLGGAQPGTVLALVAASSLLMGPGEQRLQTLLVSGYPNVVVLRVLGEMGVAGVIAVWVACLLAVRRERSLAALASAGRVPAGAGPPPPDPGRSSTVAVPPLKVENR